MDVPIAALADVLRGLHKKRVELIRVQNSLNEAPKGVSDLLSQSRNFATALSGFFVEGSELSEKVKLQLLDESGGFQDTIAKLPFRDLFNDTDRVKEELRIADGYQSYIVAPEDGLRQLFERAVEMLLPPVVDLVENVYMTVSVGVEQALRAGCEVPGIGESARPVVRFPNYVDNVLPIAQTALEDLKDEAHEVAKNVVEMEKSFLSCSFFRFLTFKRLRETYDTLDREDSERFEEDAQSGVRNLKRGKSKRDEDDEDEEDFDDNLSQLSAETPRSGTPQGNQFTSADSVFVLSGMLEKSSSHSRNKAIKAESSLWQKRFFGIIEESRIMEYYASEESFLKGGKARGIVDLSVCVVEETDGDDLPTSSVAKSVDHLDRRNAVSLLIKIRAKNRRDVIFKNNRDLILRAPDAAEKYRWYSHLKAICNDNRFGATVASWSSKERASEPADKGDNHETNLNISDMDDLGDPMVVGHGLGSAVFWSDLCRDDHGTLLPSPGIFLEGDLDLSMDKALRQHTRDMHTYTKLVCQTLSLTIPKVIVHCLVDQARERLGPVIEEHVLQLPAETREILLEEDPGLSIHRDKVSELMKHLAGAEEKVKLAQRGEGQVTDTHARLPMDVISTAGLMSEVSKEQNSQGVYKYNAKPPRAKTPPASRPPERAKSPQPVANSNADQAQRLQQRPSNRGAQGTPAPSRPAPAPPVRRAPPPPNTNAVKAGGPQKQQSQLNQQRQQGKNQGFFSFRPFEKQ